MEEKEIVRMTVIMETLAKEVHTLNERLRDIEKRLDTDTGNLEKSLSTSDIRLAVIEERVNRMSSILYGCIAAVAIEALTIFGGILHWLVTSKP